ncbi:MAG TPA: HAD family phosphatase [Verrucomicrobiae bacterium]|nr:HAD family phosphatase [Verrucomicrobiae bacterium]
MIPKVVVFDLGKVLLDFDYAVAAHRIAEKSTAGVEESRFFIDQSPLLHRYECGTITTEQFFGEICQLSGFTGTSNEFAEFFSDIFAPIPAMIQLHADLRAAGIPTYIFSNTNDLAIMHVRRRFPFFANFDGYILSYEHGVMKPNPRIYRAVEEKSGHRGREIAYLDDRAENVLGGAQRGWNAVLHESPEKSRRALQALGLLPSDA